MKGPIRIGHILPWPAVGGVERGAHDLARLLEERGYRNVAYCLADAAAVRELFAASGIDTAGYRAARPSYRHPREFLLASLSLARDFRRRGVRLVHCADLLAGYYATLAAKLARLPVVCHVRCLFPEITLRERSFLWPVDRFAFVSQAARDQFGYRAAALHRGAVVYDSVDCDPTDRTEAAREVRGEFGIPSHRKIVGSIARIAEAKDYLTLVRAAANILKVLPETVFLIVGDYASQSTYRRHYEQVRTWVSESGIESHVIFTGHRDDARRLLAAMDVSVLCTHSEGFSLAVLESMAQGIPIVATAVGGNPEVIRHGQNGLLHAHRNHEELAGAVLALLNDPAYAARLAEVALRDIRERFSSAAYLGRIENIYRSLLHLPTRTAASLSGPAA